MGGISFFERNMTVQDLRNYKCLEQIIRVRERQLDDLRINSTISDRVTASADTFPFCQTHVKVTAGTHSGKIAEAEKEINRLKQLRHEIEYCRAIIDDPTDKRILEMTLRGQSQSEIGKALSISQQTVSRRLARICAAVS